MIVGKYSALIGTKMFLYALIAILSLVGCCLTGGIFTYVGVLNLILNGWVIVSIYKRFRTKE